MKSSFIGWYPKSSGQISSIWKNAIFVPDANILLHCVRHPKPVREELMRLFGALGESLWIPYQVGLEFHRNRLDVERTAWDAYDQVERECTKAFNQACDRLRQLRAHPTIEIDRELAALETFSADFKGRLESAKGDHPVEEISAVVDQLTVLFDGRVGKQWSEKQLQDIKKEGDARYARKCPPGYLDIKKDEDPFRKFGDLIIWKDMIEKAKQEKRPIIFVSDDAKEDWWWIHRGQKKGARPELTEEFQNASGQEFHIYEFSNFIRVAAQNFPGFQDGVDEIEKSLEHDKVARKLITSNRAISELDALVRDLEDQRDETTAKLSGDPVANSSNDAVRDRSTLRVRLAEIEVELAKLVKLRDEQEQASEI